MSELRRLTETLFEHWDSPDSNGEETVPALGDARKTLALIDFYAVALRRIIDVTNRCEEAAMIDSLTPIRLALEDGARAYCEGTDRQFELVFKGEDNAIDARLLGRVQIVLQHLIGDVFLRSNGNNLRIDLSVEKKNGVLFWTLGDDGDNFITDSRLDRDECLAFYPGLRKVRRVLEELQSLLWVEPDGSGTNRFAFTTPVSPEDGRFMVWGTDGDSVAVFASQIAGVHTLDDVEVMDDDRGETVIVDGRRIRVLRLGQLLAGGPEDGDKVVIIGSLETRIAFFVNGKGALVDGIWKKEAVPTWRGMENGVVQVGDERVPLIDANELLKRYMAIVDAVAEEDVSGGVDTEVSDPSHAQAHMELDAQTPPERLNEDEDEDDEREKTVDGALDVLVIEQSTTLRTALESILAERTINTIVVDGLDDAREILKNDSPRLIISDFRVPSMSAKALADELGSEGKRIPVLVTTTHGGENADVLVERLGVDGYIRKPLEPDDVWSRVGAFLEPPDKGFSGN
jgi:CheY-like chemotaxis protein